MSVTHEDNPAKEQTSDTSDQSRQGNGPIKVLIADDHAVYRLGLSHVFEKEPDISLVGEAVDGHQAIQKVVELQPDVVLMDVLMPRCDGVEAMINAKRLRPGTKVLMLTVSDRDDHLFQALRAGAEGYLAKEAGIGAIIEAIREVASGRIVLSPCFTTKLVAELRADSKQFPLSERENEILRLIGEGFTNTEITEQLFIGESTVRTHIHRIMEKLHLKTRSEVAIHATNNHFNHANHTNRI
jgi:two-component system NarL family response regulator